MSQIEFIEWKLKQNMGIIEDLKKEHIQKSEEIKNLEASDVNADVEEKKSILIKIQESHKKELISLKERHKKERDEAMSAYLGSKNKKGYSLNSAKRELKDISDKLCKLKIENRKLNQERHKVKNTKDIEITKHAVVQYLNRAIGMNIDDIKVSIRKKILTDGIEIKDSAPIQDHQVVDYLGSTGTFVTKDGFRLAVSGGKVVTFLPKKDKPRKKIAAIFRKEKREPKKMKL